MEPAGSGAVRRAAAVVALASFSAALPTASAAVADSGAFVLPLGTSNASGWVTVTLGHSVHYVTQADAYIAYSAEVESQGPVGGGDGGGMEGCVAWDREFRFRMTWSNQQMSLGRAANVTYRIELLGDDSTCPRVDERVQPVAPAAAFPAVPAVAVAAAVGSVCSALAIGFYLALRGKRGKKQSMPEAKGDQPKGAR